MAVIIVKQVKMDFYYHFYFRNVKPAVTFFVRDKVVSRLMFYRLIDIFLSKAEVILLTVKIMFQYYNVQTANAQVISALKTNLFHCSV
mgnify:CR=1 FL=1